VKITGTRIAVNARDAKAVDLWLSRGRVFFSAISDSKQRVLDLSGFLILPGLINAHDHLELNLFPRLGRAIYPNATAWAEDIHYAYKSSIEEQRAVPKRARFRWGATKNLLSGVTTVAQHNALPSAANRENLPIRVLTRYGWAHSLHFCRDWHERFQATPEKFPFFIHAAEGTDEAARKEIDILNRGGALTPSTVLVHGVGIGRKQLKWVEDGGCSLVWCPSSNHFTLGCSLDREILNARVPIALGTDSALTAKGDLLDELHVAHNAVPAERLYDMVTCMAARILKLPPGYGEIRYGGPADLLVMRDDGLTPAETLLRASPQLVIVRGRIELVSADFPLSDPGELFEDAFPLQVENRGTYFLRNPIKPLIDETRHISGREPRLAGKQLHHDA